MIPGIEEIVDMLLSGQIAREQAIAWLNTHAGLKSEADSDFPLGKACDLSGEGECEACQ